jgi:inward rectifier potassium channel
MFGSMRNRWYHRATLHDPHAGQSKRPSWLELFYDLIFVAAFIQLGNALAGNVDLAGFAGFAAVFAPMWIAWAGTTFFINRFTTDDFVHRLSIIAQMFAVGGMAVFAPQVLSGSSAYFAGACATALTLVALLYVRAWRQVPEGRDHARYWGGVFAIAAALWGASVVVPTPYRYGLWALGVLAVVTAPFSRHSLALNQRYPWDHEHLSERFGLLTLIVLGESFVKVLSTLDGGGDLGGLFQASFTLLITCCLWWIYFDDVAGSKLRKGPLVGLLWLFGHLPLQIAVTGVGVAVKKAATFDFAAVAPEPYRWLLAGTLAMGMISVALLDSVTERQQAELSDAWRVRARIVSAVLLLILPAAGSGMTAGVFVALVTAVCVAQVVFDMMMAPLEALPEHTHLPLVADLAREKANREAAGVPTAPHARARIGEAVRKGAPSELRSDAYIYFMTGPWSRFLIALVFCYLALNVFFAGLFLLQPGCISAARADSFADAFFFSVQTLATIGYGAMSPATEYGHLVVTLEAAVGMLFIALATGLTFAKVSRPKASVLFSRPLVVTPFHGVPTLILRLGNARGNEIVDASLSVTALIEEISPEGHHMRRMHDLTLTRARSPLFTLTWVAMHPIDDKSPLHGCDFRSDGNLLSIVATIIGHDGTYGQTVYARRQYFPEDIRVGHHFVDVISQLPDGRLLLDYEKFHDTQLTTPPGTT